MLSILLLAACSRPAPEPALFDQTLSGNFDIGTMPAASGQYEQPYVIGLAAGQTIRVSVRSGDFDAKLRIEGPDGRVEEDDDSGGGQDAQLVFTADTTGPHLIVATQYSGNRGRFTVEVERLASTQRTIGTSGEVSGHLTSTQGFDEYRVRVPDGADLSFTVFSEDFDSYVELRGPDGSFEDDDSAGEGDARITHHFEQGGTYVVRARSYSSSDPGSYRLRVDDFTGLSREVVDSLALWGGTPPAATLALDRPHDVHPDESIPLPSGMSQWTYALSGATGSLRLQLSGADPPWTWSITNPGGATLDDAPADQPLVVETYESVLFVTLTAPPGSDPGELVVTRSASAPPPPAEVLRPLPVGGWRAGVLSQRDLVQDDPQAHYEVWSAQLQAGTAYLFEMDSTDVDSFLILLDAGKNVLATDDDGGAMAGGDGRDARLRHTARSTGTYYLMATTAAAYETGSYRVRLSEQVSGGFSGIQR